MAVERERGTAEKQRQIHLFAEGNFYRAYEWSAWLFSIYVEGLKLTCRMVKSVDAKMVFLGFPKSSLGKFTPAGSSPKPVDETHLILPLPETIIKGAANMEQDFAKWKDALPLTEAKEKTQQPLADRPVSMTAIMKKLLDFQIEQHSPIECMMFISELKRQLAAIL